MVSSKTIQLIITHKIFLQAFAKIAKTKHLNKESGNYENGFELTFMLDNQSFLLKTFISYNLFLKYNKLSFFIIYNSLIDRKVIGYNQKLYSDVYWFNIEDYLVFEQPTKPNNPTSDLINKDLFVNEK